MKVAALISGGKDSCCNMLYCVAEGHQICALANLKPKDKDELDSYMYQTVGHHAIELFTEAMGVPLYRRTIEGKSKEIGMDYLPTDEDEVEDLFELLKDIKEKHNIEAVSSGAILSNYQRIRVENVCQRLGLVSMAYLWRRDQKELLKEMINCDISAIIIKVAALGLHPDEHLGKSLTEMYPHMLKMNNMYGLNICGEGGEYETFTLDCPLFKKRIVIDEVEKVLHSKDTLSPAGYLNLKKFHLEDKSDDIHLEQSERIKKLSLKTSASIINDLHFTPDDIRSFNKPDKKSRHLPRNTDNLHDTPTLVHCTEKMLWLSGICAKFNSTDCVADVTQKVMDSLKGKLQEAGNLGMESLLAVHLYVNDMNKFAEINSTYKPYFTVNPPMRICVEASLPSDVLLMIDAYACSNRGDISTKGTMHIQGISHWAPANIGPYSQAVKFDEKIYVAGQIALIPGSMKIIEGGINTEARLSLRHVHRILEVMHSGCSLLDVVMGICYLTDISHITVAQCEWKRAIKTIEMHESSKKLNSLLEYVVVPSLPRQASIEWQTYASSSENHLIEESKSYPGDMLHVTVSYVYTSDGNRLFGCKGNVEMNSKMDDCRLLSFDVARAFFTFYKDVLEDAKMKWSDVPLLRIFFPHTKLPYHELWTGIYNTLSQYTDSIPAFSLIPVEYVSSEKCVLSVCH